MEMESKKKLIDFNAAKKRIEQKRVQRELDKRYKIKRFSKLDQMGSSISWQNIAKWAQFLFFLFILSYVMQQCGMM